MTRQLALAATVALCASTGAHAAQFTIQDIGDLGGSKGYTFAHGMNDLGQIVGTSSYSTQNHAFLWDPLTGMQDLGDLGSGTRYSIATDINNKGQVVGSASNNDLRQHAFRWSADGGMQDLGVLNATEDYSFATAINDLGEVVGYSSTSAYGTAGFKWTENGGMERLFALDEARDINNLGQIVGYKGYSARLIQNGETVDLGDIPGTYNDDYANGINNAGDIVGQGARGNPFVYDTEGGMASLGKMFSSDYGGKARSINGAGQIVGEIRSGYRRTAFLWDETDGMQALNDLIDPSLGITLSWAAAINENGMIVANGYTDTQRNRAFLLTPVAAQVPLPAGLPLLGTALAGFAILRRRAA